MINLYIEADSKEEIMDYLHLHDELQVVGHIQRKNKEKPYYCRLKIVYNDGIIRGEDAKRIWDEINRERTPEEIEKSDRGAEKLAKLFEGKVKW